MRPKRDVETRSAPAPALATAPSPPLPPSLLPPNDAPVTNWSGTREVVPAVLAQPESLAELEAVVAAAHAARAKLRPVGSALSPNGLAFEAGGMVSLALMDKVMSVDKEARTVTAQAGARVADVTAALKPHGLTLPVYASIKEQSIGGYLQAGVHGTGARIPPADAAALGLTLVTPGRGTLRLTASDPLFRLATVGLGALGVVAEATLACDAATWLVETTRVVERAAAVEGHAARLAAHRHVRYMWIPYVDAVVIVTLDEAAPGTQAVGPAPDAAAARAPLDALVPRAAALRGGAEGATPGSLSDLSPMLLRQWLLGAAPLDAGWVAAVNAAEAAHWARAAGGRAGWSDDMLGFDCAGAQWVLEVALPAGTLERPTGADMRFMADLLAAAEAAGVPAPAPIEQRWTAGSPSTLSPAAGGGEDVFTWVGVIMYVPDADADDASSSDAAARPASVAAVEAAFDAYAGIIEKELGPRYGACEHWAKVEPRRLDVRAKRAALGARFPGAAAAFADARRELDPRNVLGGAIVDALFPHPGEKEGEEGGGA